MKIDKDELLTKAKELLKDEVTPISFNTWFKSLDIQSISNDHIVFTAVSEFQKDMLENKYNSLLINTLSYITNKNWTFSVVDLSSKDEDPVEIISEKGYDISVLDTICNATEERQTEARKIAAESDLMIVIGDKHSSNTQKLYEISKKECANTYYIQTIKDLDLTRLKSTDNVGITAGASTPNNIIEEVQKNVRNEF